VGPVLAGRDPTAEVKQSPPFLGPPSVSPRHPISTGPATRSVSATRYSRQERRVENLKTDRRDNGNLVFRWALVPGQKRGKHVWHDEGFAIDARFVSSCGSSTSTMPLGQLAEAATPSASRLEQPRCSSRTASRSGPNKVMVARSAGAGSVVGYNYVDMGYINTNGAWIEIGQRSHRVGSHHVSSKATTASMPTATHTGTASTTVLPQSPAWHPGPFENQAGGGSMTRVNRATHLAQRWLNGLLLLDVLRRQRVGPRGRWRMGITRPRRQARHWMLGWDGVKPYRPTPG